MVTHAASSSSACSTISSPHTSYTKRVDLTKDIPRDVIVCDAPDCQQPSPSIRCTRCFTAYYCSANCQQRALNDHKPFCNPLDRMIEKQKELLPMDSISEMLPKNAIGSNRSGSTESEGRQNGAGRRPNECAGVEASCHICLSDPMKDPVTMKNCRHSFCCQCIMTWQAKSTERRHLADATRQQQQSQGDEEINDNNRTNISFPDPVCPVCREDTDKIEESCLNRALYLATEANVRNLSDDDRTVLRREALACVDKVLDVPACSIQAHFSKANILLSMRAYEKTLEAVEELLHENKRRNNHPVLLLIQNAEETFARGDMEESKRLQDQVLAAVQLHGMPASQITSDKFFDVYVIQSEAYQGLEMWNEAMDSYKKAMHSLDGPESVPAVDKRKLFMSLAECSYKVQEYDKSVKCANAAIEMNRHFPGIHRLKALALEKLGRLDEAIVTMNRGVLYETPWDDENQRNVLSLYNNLVSKKVSSS